MDKRNLTGGRSLWRWSLHAKRAETSLKSLASSMPLLATLISPASTLYDIPALGQRWYAYEGVSISDPNDSLILSAISLACSILANALLVMRFTVHAPNRWRLAIIVSTLGWVLKTAIGIANLIVFGATKNNGPGYSYIEGDY